MFKRIVCTGFLLILGSVSADLADSPTLVCEISEAKILYSQVESFGAPLKTFILSAAEFQQLEKKDFTALSNVPAFQVLKNAFLKCETTSILFKFCSGQSFAFRLNFANKNGVASEIVVLGMQEAVPDFILEFVKYFFVRKNFLQKSVEMVAKTVAVLGAGALLVADFSDDSSQKLKKAVSSANQQAVGSVSLSGIVEPESTSSLTLAPSFGPKRKMLRMRYFFDAQQISDFLVGQMRVPRGLFMPVSRAIAIPRLTTDTQAPIIPVSIVGPEVLQQPMLPVVFPAPLPPVVPEILLEVVLPMPLVLGQNNTAATPRARRAASKGLVEQLKFKILIFDDLIKGLKAGHKSKESLAEVLDFQIKRAVLVASMYSLTPDDKENSEISENVIKAYERMFRYARAILEHVQDSFKITLRGLTTKFMDAHAKAGNPISGVYLLAQRRSLLRDRSLMDKAEKSQIIDQTAEIARKLASARLSRDGDFIAF